MRRFVPLLIAGTALIAAACRDAVAPSRSTSAVVERLRGPAAMASIVSSSPAGTSLTFQIDPRGGSVKIGGFRLDYDANAVCDPATSGYGPEYWLASCSTLTAPITMKATVWYTPDGEAMADFSPNIRFRPDAVVMLSVKRPKTQGRSLSSDEQKFWSVVYFKDVDGVRQSVDEAATDAELSTKFDSNYGLIWRRIRHFTGYYVRSGEPCDETLGDPNCVASPTGLQ